MGFFDFLKSKEPQEEAKLVSEGEQHLRDPYHTAEARVIITKLPTDLETLRLDDIRKNAEAVVNYLRGLAKDVEAYRSVKPGLAQERVRDAISKKVKFIAQRGLEIRNLIALLETHYYQVLLDALAQLHVLTNDPFLDVTKRRLQQDLVIEKDAEAKLTKVIGYDLLLNAEKNPHFQEELAKVVHARELHKDVQDLLSMINKDVLDQKNGLLARIRQERIVEALRIKATV